MAKKVAPVPKGYRTVTPYLVVRGADTALDFYAHVFNADVISRTYGDDEITVLHSEMKIGNSIVTLSDEMPAFGILSPVAYGGSGTAQHLYLPNVDEVWERAVEAGCTVLVPLMDTSYGERFGKVVDPFGHVWSMSKRIPVVKPQEIKAQTQTEGFSIYETETPADAEADKTEAA